MYAQFAEAPPGVEERALLAAVANLVLVGAIAYLQGVLGKTPLPTDVPVVVLALPGFAATWFGFDSDADTVLRSSLTARVSLLMTGLLSLGGTLYYLLESHIGWQPRPHLSILGVHNDFWWTLIVLAGVNVALILRRSVSRMRQFVALSSRPRAEFE